MLLKRVQLTGRTCKHSVHCVSYFILFLYKNLKLDRKSHSSVSYYFQNLHLRKLIYKYTQILNISLICIVLDNSFCKDMFSLPSYYSRCIIILDLDCSCIQKSFGLLGVTMLLNTLLHFIKPKIGVSNASLFDIRYLQFMNKVLYSICSKIFYYKY